MHGANISHTDIKCTLHECSLVTLTLNSLFIRAGKFWFVYTEVGKETGFLVCSVKEEDGLTPPLHDWQYYNAGGGKWESDSTMICSREVSPPCREVRVCKLACLILIWIKLIERR